MSFPLKFHPAKVNVKEPDTKGLTCLVGILVFRAGETLITASVLTLCCFFILPWPTALWTLRCNVLRKDKWKTALENAF